MSVSLIDGHIDEPKSKIIKCTGERCPMQIGYDVANCQCEGCSYRTTPMTNYDRIRNMSVEEMKAEIWDLSESNDVLEDKLADYRKRNEELITEINRQKAEIERLREQFRYLDIECERLEKTNEAAKAEAYKECVEKIKAYFRKTRFAYDAENLCEELDDLLKEKVGAEK